MRTATHLLLGGPLVGPAIAPASGQPPAAALELIGPDQVARNLSLAERAALPQVEIETLDRDGSRAVFRGPALRSLATMAGAPAGHALRGPNLLTAILAEAFDGYRAGDMLAEVDEQFGARQAIVALSRNGEPLPPDEGPFRAILAGEQHHARWIRQLVRLRVVTLRQ